MPQLPHRTRLMARPLRVRAALASALLAVTVLTGFSAAPPVQAQTPPPVRVLEVWARATFGPDGRLEQLELADEESHSPAFAEEVRNRLSAARIQPPQDQGQPARFTTGVRLRYRVAAGEEGAQLRLLNLAVSPLPLQRTAPPLPIEIRRSQGWTGSIRGTCSVDEQGACAEVAIEALPGMPESLRRWTRLTMGQWRFEPQRLNDRPVPGEFSYTFDIRVGETMPQDFRVPKFDRIERQRM